MGNLTIRGRWVNQDKMGERRAEGHNTDPRNTKMEETCRRQRRMEACSEGAQGPQWAVTP
jgi:hypothetical protein